MFETPIFGSPMDHQYRHLNQSTEWYSSILALPMDFNLPEMLSSGRMGYGRRSTWPMDRSLQAEERDEDSSSKSWWCRCIDRTYGWTHRLGVHHAVGRQSMSTTRWWGSTSCPMVSLTDGQRILEWLEHHQVHQQRKLVMVTMVVYHGDCQMGKYGRSHRTDLSIPLQCGPLGCHFRANLATQPLPMFGLMISCWQISMSNIACSHQTHIAYTFIINHHALAYINHISETD